VNRYGVRALQGYLPGSAGKRLRNDQLAISDTSRYNSVAFVAGYFYFRAPLNPGQPHCLHTASAKSEWVMATILGDRVVLLLGSRDGNAWIAGGKQWTERPIPTGADLVFILVVLVVSANPAPDADIDVDRKGKLDGASIEQAGLSLNQRLANASTREREGRRLNSRPQRIHTASPDWKRRSSAASRCGLSTQRSLQPVPRRRASRFFASGAASRCPTPCARERLQ
jgi:hypothetical protein